jgi:hypothetical protein
VASVLGTTATVGYDPTTRGVNLKFTDYQAGIQVPVYEAMTGIPMMEDVGRPYGSKIIRIYDTLATATLAATSNGDKGDLTWNSGIPSKVTLTPSGLYIAVSYPENEQNYVEAKMDPGITQNINAAMGEGCDALAMVSFSSLTNGWGDAGSAPTAPDVRKVVAQLSIATPAARLSDGVSLYAVVHPGAQEGLQNTADFTNAEVRGDAENPQVKGFFTKANGVLWNFTTKVPTANGNGGEGAIFAKSCFALGWNQKPMILRERDGLATCIIGYANLAATVVYASRGRYFRTVVTV